MKVDRTRLKKSASDIPPECQILIDKLRLCSRAVLLEELSRIETWTFGKCELYHWIDILDTFDVILEEACTRQIDNEWALVCDVYFTNDNKKLLLWVLHFTTLLIEHSFSRHLYNSMEHLVSLLSSSDMQIVLGVLNLLYMFSKRSNFITRLNSEKRQTLLIRLFYLAESWGGKDNGFGLADCCRGVNTVPQSASILHFEFYEEKVTHNQTSPLRYIHIESVDKLDKTPAEIMNELVQQYRIPQDKQMRLFTQLRLACCFADYKIRMYCVQARLQALSVLVYSNALTDNLNPHVLLYNGLLEELVELLKLQLAHLVEIRSAALRTLTSIIHLDRNPNPHFPNKKPGARLRSIIDVTGASSYHGFLPTLVRQCISTLIGQPGATSNLYSSSGVSPSFPLPLATALFSFLYHLASYDSGGKALKACGMMEALLRVIKWPGTELDHITFVTRAVRVIDLITNIDMQAFQTHGGLNSFITRLHMEINYCRTEQPFEIAVPITASDQKQIEDIRDQLRSSHELIEDAQTFSPTEQTTSAPGTNKTCLPQRAALLKSMLNFLKKAIQESTFAESIRHVMEGTLPSSLKHIISNAEYYGPSLFLLATDVVTVYVFQEPSLLSSLQDNGLTDVVLHALLIKDVPATREVLASLPNVFSALCLNSRGLDSFVRCRPFDRLFKVLLSPSYLTAMRRRRSADPMGDTATNLGNAMDELMRHQPTLKVDAMTAIISLLFELNYLGTDPKYVCWRAQNKCDVSPVPSQSQTNSTEGGSSDEEEDDEEEASTSSHNHREDSTQDSTTATATPTNNEKTPIALVDYIVNVTKFVDAILSNNSTDDHCKEFVAQEGLRPLLRILRLPNLPVDYPITVAAQSVASVCKSILNLAHEPRVLTLGLTQLLDIVENLKSLKRSRSKSTTGSVLLNELANAPCLETAFSSYTATPLLHTMGEAHGYVVMFVHVCRTGQSDIRNLSLQYWSSEVGLEVLRGLAELYTTLVWESTLLLALCSDDIIPEGCDFGREDMEKLVPSDIKNDDSSHDESSCSLGMTSAMEALSTTDNMEIDHENVATQTEQREERVSPTSQQLKYIKPLLGASSRLGRALAELFGLLVKLCVGSQARSRRGQNNPVTSTIHSGAARRVATALNVLLTQGMSWNSLPPSPIPKFRLTFLICSVGFTSPMLFDEKRYPYHLMLCKFMNLGGQQAFFDTFKWALSGGGQFSLEEGFEHPDLPDGTGEFLDVWLMLLEKMVNPTALLESPNVCYTKQTNPNQKSIPQGPKIDFDPLKYLIHIQKAAFECVMLMWGRKPLKTYGARMTESILSILRHILQGEKVIKDALAKRANDKTKSNEMVAGVGVGVGATDDVATVAHGVTTGRAGTSVTAAAAAGSATTNTTSVSTGTPGNPSISIISNVRTDQINQDHLQLLMDMGFSMEMCTEALLNTHSFEQATDYLLNNPNMSSRGADMELGEDDQIVKAIAMSLGEIPAQETPKENPPPEDDTPLDSELIDNFANNVLPVCLDLLDQLPDSVYSVCELIFALAKRNGDNYRHKIVHSIVCEIVDKIFLLLNTGSDKSLHTLVNALIKSETGSQVAVRLHLLALIIDSPTHKEMKIPCGLAINREGLLQILVKLLIGAEQALTDAPKELLTCTPKWLSPLLLVLDLTDKVARQTLNKSRMHEATTSKWQWYDMAVGKWNAYSYHNNVVIDAAYWKGEPTVRVTCGRRRYTLQFTDMVQVSDETGNTRPIMMTIVNMQKKQTAKTGEEDMEAEEQSSEQSSQQRPLEQRTRIVKGIDQAKTRLVTRSCVRLMRLPLDIETLHAVMRVLLRYTRDFENAKLFAEEGGIRLLLDLTLASNFTGFESIATLLIRHVFEGPSVMEMTMEKVLRAKSAANFPPECRELVYLSRHLGSAIARDSDTFTELAKRIWFPDLSMDMAKRNEDNPPKEIFVKSKACARNQQEAEINEIITVRAIEDLMIALAKPDAPLTITTPSPTNSTPSTASTSNAKSSSSASASATPRNYLIPRIMQNELSPLVEATNDEDIVTLPGRKPKETPNITTKLIEDESRKPLIRKSDILRILSDAVRSYIIVGKYITFFVYKPEHSELITEEMTAMTFLLDKLLPSTDNASDPDRHTLTRMLISSIAACHQMPETQLVLIWDVRNSLLRAVGMPESAEKHIQMQMIASLISTIIEHCPPLASLQMKTRFHVHPLNYLNMTHMIRLILRRGIVADLARFTHCIDLSSPHLAATINAALKPLDILTRVLNQPLPPLKVPRKVNNVNDGGASISQSGATGSENTHAQRDDAVGEDADNTEADLSTAGESLGGRAEADEREGVEAALVDIMGQILDQDQNERSNTGNSALNDTMDIDEEPFLDRNDTEESESESNSSGEDDDEDDDDNDDDNGQHVNNEESSAYEDDTEPETEFFEDDLLRMLPAFERNDEDILMIQYSDQNSETDRPTRRFHWNSSGFTTMPFGMQFQESTPPNHPLLINRHNSENSNIPGTRGQRASRQRRLQYLQLNPMNPPQIILQRLLGPYPDPIYSPISGVDDTPRVVIMDQNFGIFSNEEEQIDVVDQSGYLLGPHLSGGLNNVPIALYWWNEESRMCDGSAVLDSAMYFSNVMYAHLDAIRTADLAERKILKRMTSDTSAATSTSKSTSSSTTEKSNVMENLLNAVISDLPPSQRSTSTSTNDPCLVSSDMLSQRSLQNSVDMLDINDFDIPMVTDQSISNTMQREIQVDLESISNSMQRETQRDVEREIQRSMPREIQDDLESITNSMQRETQREVEREIQRSMQSISQRSMPLEMQRVMRREMRREMQREIQDDVEWMSNEMQQEMQRATQREIQLEMQRTTQREIQVEMQRTTQREIQVEMQREMQRRRLERPRLMQREIQDDQSISNLLQRAAQDASMRATEASSIRGTEVVSIRATEAPSVGQRATQATSDVGTNPVDTLTDHSIRMPRIIMRPSIVIDPCFPDESLPLVTFPLVTASPFDALDSLDSFVHPIMFGDEPNTDIRDERITDNENDRSEHDEDAEIETQPTVRQIGGGGTILTSSVGTSTTPALDEYLSETTFPPPPYSIIEITTGNNTVTTETVITTTPSNTMTGGDSSSTAAVNTLLSSQSQGQVTSDEIVVETGTLTGQPPPAPSEMISVSEFFNFPTNTNTNTSNTNTTGTPTPMTPITPMATASAPPLSDLELPEDVDPSFLAALPEEMRAEVIAEQLRLQRIRRRTAQQEAGGMTSQSNADMAAASSSNAPASNTAPDISEVSPDFLAALPPAIQEEVLAQQRLEQQRQMAAAANPNDPVDAAAFFQILHPALRQDILTDMEESQISVLPPDLAAEAQTLRRDWEARNRQLMQERFLSQIAQSNNALSSMLRRSTIYPTSRGPRYIHPVTQRNPHWSSWGPSFPARNTEQRQMRNTVVRVRGRQLLDLESISCLLVLLFQNNPKIHVLRFYRCMRNFCYHGPTRDWVIKALLSILDKCVNAKPIDTTGSSQSLRRSKRLASKVSGECTSQNWLNINLEAALGCKTNVFIVNKASSGSGTAKKGEKKSNTTATATPSIDIHHQAALIAARQTLDLLIQLAKSFPSCFLPLRVKSGNKKKPIPPKNKSTKTVPDFWDLLLKLDSTKPPTPIKKYRFPPRTYANIPGPDSDWNFASTFETSGFGQLLTMLDAPTVKKNSQLVDKFLRLLYMITRGLPELPQYLSGNKHIVRFRYIEKYESIMNYEDKLRIIVNTITWKRCSEDGLDCATLMLHNLSHVSDDMRKTVINLLWYGAFVLSRVVDTHIKALLNELQRMKEQQQIPFDDDTSSRLVTTMSSSSSSSNSGNSNATGGANSNSATGILNDRFTKEPIIVTASTKQRSTCDLQLSSMSQLVSKNSSQAYFLKLLRVIVQVLDTKKKTTADNKQTTDAGTSAAGASATSAKTDDTTAMEVSTDPGPSSQASTSAAPPTPAPTSAPITKELPINSTSPATYMDSKLFEDKPLSAMLSLGSIWQTLSKCLLELEHTPDHHAVLVLQPAVEAFFLVHTRPKSRNRRQTYTVDDGPTLNSIFETTVDIPNEEENVIVPPLSPIQVNTVVDLLYSSDSDETRVYDNNSSTAAAAAASTTESNTTATPTTTTTSASATSDEQLSNNTDQQQLGSSEGQTTVTPSTSTSTASTSDVEVPESLITRYEALAYEKMAASGGLPCFINDMDISDELMTTVGAGQDLQSSSSPSQSSHTLTVTPTPTPTSNDSTSMDDKRKFVAFAERHRTVLNQILRQSTGNLADGPFAVLVDHTRILDFDVKRRYFRSELERLDNGIRREELAVHVRRSHVFEDSFRELYRRSAEEWKNRFYIVFEEEEGQDAGGLLREWYMIISRDIFNPMYALFTVSPGDRVTYMINSSSYCNPNHLCYYKFVGRVIAKAIYDNKLLECYFTRSFYKHILGKQVKYTDMESEDYSFYKGLVYLMEHVVADLGYDLTFSTEVQEFGVTNVRDLIPNGSKVPVNEDNKMEYIRLVCQMKMTVSIQKQLNAFLEGFYDIIPKRLISIFNEQELELLISGLPNIDIDDLKNNTEYHKYQANSLQIQWFWRALRSFDQADRAKFLQFVTGTSKVPLQGFGSLEGMNGVQKFQIHRDDRSTDRLPSAHTCFNQLDLPVYETYDKLRLNLLKAIQECSEGFGFA